MSHLDIHDTPIAGLRIVTRKPIIDERGQLQRLFCQKSFSDLLDGRVIRQINHTVTRKEGAVRGLHFQYPPHAEIKLVSCIKGSVWDVALDIRRGSPTFLRYYAMILSLDNLQSLLIPEGFAHGFQALTQDCELLYFHTADYRQNAEGGLNATDPKLAIKWPRPITERSKRDISFPLINSAFSGIDVI